LSDSFPFQYGIKYGDALSSLFLNVALEYAIVNAQETQLRLKLNGAHQLMAYIDYMSKTGDNIDTVNKDTQTLILLVRRLF
jgi:hypothetical protein